MFDREQWKKNLRAKLNNEGRTGGDQRCRQCQRGGAVLRNAGRESPRQMPRRLTA